MRRPSGAVVGAVLRAASVRPSSVGALAAVAALIGTAAADKPDPTLALVAALLLSTSPVGFALDDEAAETVAASPTTLRWRRSLAAGLGCIGPVAAWSALVPMVTVVWPEQRVAVGELAVELLALVLVTLAMAARWGGAAAGLAAPSATLVLSAFAVRFSALPTILLGGRHPWRWSLVAVVSAVWLMHELRDPAAPRHL